jgi:hypothetical protein
MPATQRRVDVLNRYTLLLFVVLACVCGRVAAMTDVEAMQLGYRVAAVKAALKDPAAPGSMQAITSLGHDQRYYVMVRGWLTYRLQADRSLLESNPDQPELRLRVDFMERAIRAIDLE